MVLKFDIDILELSLLEEDRGSRSMENFGRLRSLACEENVLIQVRLFEESLDVICES